MTRRSHGLANRPGKPYPATFRIVHQWTDRESNPDLRHARAVSFRWTMSPSFPVDLIGVEPITPILQGSVAPIGMQAHHQRSVRELNPVFILTTDACCREHLQTMLCE